MLMRLFHGQWSEKIKTLMNASTVRQQPPLSFMLVVLAISKKSSTTLRKDLRTLTTNKLM